MGSLKNRTKQIWFSWYHVRIMFRLLTCMQQTLPALDGATSSKASCDTEAANSFAASQIKSIWQVVGTDAINGQLLAGQR